MHVCFYILSYLLCYPLTYRSSDFRPCFSRVHELRALVQTNISLMALTATVTSKMRKDIIQMLDMSGCHMVSASPNRANIFYEVRRRTTVEDDVADIVDDLQNNSVHANRVIIYCRSLNMCAHLYTHFLHSLGTSGYYPPGSPEISDHRIFGMYHSNTTEHNKKIIMESLSKEDGIVRAVFATMALGMGVDFSGLNRIIHYGAPRTIDDYFQESGRAGRTGELSISTVFWSPPDAPLRKDTSDPHIAEAVAVRNYLENEQQCRRFQLLSYFDYSLASNLPPHDPTTCCDVCKQNSQS